MTLYEKIERSLYHSADDGAAAPAALRLTPREEEVRRRMMLCVSRRMDNPMLEDSELVDFLMSGCAGQTQPVSRSQAYRDISMVTRLVGNVQLAARQWYRYTIAEGAKRAYTMAMEQGDAKGAAAALDKLGKYTRADKEDERPDFDRLIPPSFEPSDDITLLEGLRPIPDLEERRRHLRRLAKNMLEAEAEDAREIPSSTSPSTSPSPARDS